ncbi:MAG: pyridine nucleotide-disulfide oxidoreductase [Alphaproteobacteria bacterium]|nr:pyridine nucleotide-disulfide oxidoreductase [Alphaproteobacteria bacterium]
MSRNVAIVGSGPGGFYTAEALLKACPGCRIDIIDRLPTPYGLIRAGVAPDHQTTKKVARNFRATALSGPVAYLGNVEVGRDVSVADLQACYDAVVFAIGMPHDKALGIPGEDLAGVIGSAAFVGWYNAHPDFRDLNPPLDTQAVVVVGTGNVAIDCARVLVKTRAEMAESDLPEYAQAAIEAAPIRDVYMVGRRGPIEAKFTNVELREMGELEAAMPVVDAAVLPASAADYPGLSDRDRRLKERNLASLREFATAEAKGRPKRVHFLFNLAPVAILGEARVRAVRFEQTRVEGERAVGTGEFSEIPCGLVIPAIGYRSSGLDGVPFDARSGTIANADGRVGDGLYAVGWIKRGPTGVIATNRPDGVAVAGHIAKDIASGTKPGREALFALLAGRGVRVTSFPDWERIEAAETAAAAPPAPRRKFARIKDMLELLGPGS